MSYHNTFIDQPLHVPGNLLARSEGPGVGEQHGDGEGEGGDHGAARLKCLQLSSVSVVFIITLSYLQSEPSVSLTCMLSPG